MLLKGPVTVVADPSGDVLLGRHGTPALATAGTGDVLTGVVAAFLASGLSALEAAGLAATAHGMAALGGHRVGLVAGDLPDLVRRLPQRERRMTDERRFRPAWAEIDLDALRHNVRMLVEIVGGAAVCAVVKADGYGHGSVRVSQAALEAGAVVSGGGARRGGRGAARGRHRRADPPAVRAASRRRCRRSSPAG